MPPNSGEKDSFRVYRFMNSITAYSKDKRGMNIAVRIIYALFLLKLRKLGKFVDEMEALGKYNQRYLRGKVTHRPYYFIKMLTIIPNAHFNAVAARRKGQKYFNKLSSVSLAESRLPFEIEIYPYEDLWEVVLEILGQKKSHYRKR